MSRKPKTTRRNLTFNEMLVVAPMVAAQLPTSPLDDTHRIQRAVDLLIKLKTMEFDMPAEVSK